MSATIKVFYVGDKCFRHVMSSYHDRVELRDEDDETLLTYSDNTKVFDQHGRRGSFQIEHVDGQLRWVYYESQRETRIVLAPDLPSAEVEVSRRYIQESLPGLSGGATASSQPGGSVAVG